MLTETHSANYSTVSSCRLCGHELTNQILQFRNFKQAGIFPQLDEELPTGPLTLMCCDECLLLQLAEQYDLKEMYGINYGYRSGLNASMTRHLESIVEWIEEKINLHEEDIILDIGSNDGTLLGMYDHGTFIGYDPTIVKFAKYYPTDVIQMAEFFSAGSFLGITRGHEAKVITTIAMLYDLPDPQRFVYDVASCLDPHGIWYTEQAYAGTMLDNFAYDSICQEHVEYYGLTQIHRMTTAAGLVITDIDFNDVNGGSMWLGIKKVMGGHKEHAVVKQIIDREIYAYNTFLAYVQMHPAMLRNVLADCPRVAGFGASTKGNILLQHCELDDSDIIAIADVNEDKHGCVTSTGIPIMSDEDVEALEPSHYLVLPWHFREDILKRYKGSGRKFIFPLPKPEIVDA